MNALTGLSVLRPVRVTVKYSKLSGQGARLSQTWEVAEMGFAKPGDSITLKHLMESTITSQEAVLIYLQRTVVIWSLSTQYGFITAQSALVPCILVIVPSAYSFQTKRKLEYMVMK